jgi:hypothetical protein
MWATIDDTVTACWSCESDPTDKVAIGQLGVSTGPDRAQGLRSPQFGERIFSGHMGPGVVVGPTRQIADLVCSWLRIRDGRQYPGGYGRLG